MELLGKIFGSKHRVKIMRLFLYGESLPFDIDDISSRSRVKKPDARKELAMLTKIGFLNKKSFSKQIEKPRKKKTDEITYKTLKKKGWVLNPRFELIKPLQILLLDSELINEKDLVKRIRKSGTVKLLVLSGVFVSNDDRKIDILIVGNKLKKDSLVREIQIIESEIGRELQYAFFDHAEFNYRISMYDKLIRDILENNHIKLINTINC